ncbi:MAG: hypothetical protein WDN69_22500 [Aliidongia sp.]
MAPGYPMYDGGMRFDGDTAWVAYVNRGSVTDSHGTRPQSWLESAFLRKRGGAWKIAFLHSTHAAA